MPTPSTPSVPRRWAAMALGVAMGAGNVLGYLVVLLLSRSLGPADFGGYTALSTYGVLLAIPAGAFQVSIAGRMGRADRATSGLRLAGVIGTVAWLVTCLASPALRSGLHLESTWSPVLLGAMLLPMTVTGCFQGILLGRNRLLALSTLYLVTAATRLTAAVVVRLADLSVAGVFAAMLVAASVTALVGWALCRGELRALPTHRASLGAEMARANLTLAAFIALTNIDVLFARHYLDPHTSGGYSLASTFGRAICWGTQFVALLVVPRMSSVHASRTLLRASALVLGVGVVGLCVVAAAPRFWITVAGGAQFAAYAHIAVACVCLGIAWALAQVWLFAEMGTDDSRLGLLTWVVVAAECVGIVLLHRTPMQILSVATVGAVVVAVAGFVRVWRRHQRLGAAPSASALAVAAIDRP